MSVKRVSYWTLSRDFYEVTLSREFFISFTQKPTFIVLSIEFETLRQLCNIGEMHFSISFCLAVLRLVIASCPVKRSVWNLLVNKCYWEIFMEGVFLIIYVHVMLYLAASIKYIYYFVSVRRRSKYWVICKIDIPIFFSGIALRRQQYLRLIIWNHCNCIFRSFSYTVFYFDSELSWLQSV